MRQRRTAHRILATISATVVAMGLGAAATAAAETTDRHGARVLVSDPAAERLHVYDERSHAKVASLNVVVGDHSGFLHLGGDRVAFIDERAGELVVLATGQAKILGTAPVEGEITHIATAPGARYVVAAGAHPHEEGDEEQEEPGALTLVDTGSFEASTVHVETGHPGVFLGGNPLMVIHRNDHDERFETFPVTEILEHAGSEEPLEPTSTAPTGAAGHGEAFLQSDGTFLTATDDGLDQGQLVGNRIERTGTAPWSGPGRGYYVRVSHHDVLTSYVRDESAADWREWPQAAYLFNPRTDQVTRTSLGEGNVFRHGLGGSVAGYVLQQADDDIVTFVETSPFSSSYGKVVSEVKLPGLEGRPSDDPNVGQIRRIALDSSGAKAYLTAGGAGTVEVIDVRKAKVVGAFKVPTGLAEGGAIAVIDPRAPVSDTIGR